MQGLGTSVAAAEDADVRLLCCCIWGAVFGCGVPLGGRVRYAPSWGCRCELLTSAAGARWAATGLWGQVCAVWGLGCDHTVSAAAAAGPAGSGAFCPWGCRRECSASAAAAGALPLQGRRGAGGRGGCCGSIP